MNYIQQTWKIEDDVTEWRETFKILNTEKDFFWLVILFILSQNWTRFDRVRESNCIFNIFSVNPLLSHPPLSFKCPLPSGFPLLIDGIIGYFDCGWNPKACTFPGPRGTFKWKLLRSNSLWDCLLYNLVLAYLFIYLIAFTMITILK